MFYYVGNADLPGRMAHSIQQMKMCEAFTKQGEDVVYIHGHSFGNDPKVSWDNVADHYGLEEKFSIKTLRNLQDTTDKFSRLRIMSIGGPIAVYLFLETLAGRIGRKDIIYGREYYSLFFLNEMLTIVPESKQPLVVYEGHNPRDVRFKNRFYRRIDGVVSITQKLADYLVEKHDLCYNKLLIAPDGADLEPYQGLSKEAARKQLDIPLDEEVVMYTGHCYEGKGAGTLVAAARNLDASIYIVGGFDEDIDRIKTDFGHPENVEFTGFVEPSEIPVYQVASDILVAPYTSASRPWISPLKLFEYMAANRPIAASDRSVLQEVLTHEENALIFNKEDSTDLQNTINRLLRSKSLQQTLSSNASKSIGQYTWDSRARKILDWISQI